MVGGETHDWLREQRRKKWRTRRVVFLEGRGSPDAQPDEEEKARFDRLVGNLPEFTYPSGAAFFGACTHQFKDPVVIHVDVPSQLVLGCGRSRCPFAVRAVLDKSKTCLRMDDFCGWQWTHHEHDRSEYLSPSQLPQTFQIDVVLKKEARARRGKLASNTAQGRARKKPPKLRPSLSDSDDVHAPLPAEPEVEASPADAPNEALEEACQQDDGVPQPLDRIIAASAPPPAAKKRRVELDQEEDQQPDSTASFASHLTSLTSFSPSSSLDLSTYLPALHAAGISSESDLHQYAQLLGKDDFLASLADGAREAGVVFPPAARRVLWTALKGKRRAEEWKPARPARRFASSTPSSSSASASSSSAANDAAQAVAEALEARKIDWPTYLSLRKSQRLYGLVASIPTTLIGFSAGATYFATIESDPTDLIFGIEPVYAYGIATVGCVGLGWLAGPTVGSAVWRLTHGKVAKAMEAKDKDFFKHISRWRADPSRQSASNPSPDFYAEKVGSLQQYRTWLRDQNTFRRKATFGGREDGAY
ncbi:hypothetical protein JCM8097_003800 [Rhodosporidiobolus ruineniae]